jgi:hypothetical protein
LAWLLNDAKSRKRDRADADGGESPQIAGTGDGADGDDLDVKPDFSLKGCMPWGRFPGVGGLWGATRAGKPGVPKVLSIQGIRSS